MKGFKINTFLIKIFKSAFIILRKYQLPIHFILVLYLLLNVGCGILSRTTEQHSFYGGDDPQGEKMPMRTWIISSDKIFPVIVEVVKTSFPKSKIHENSQKNRLHFWYLDSEQGDALIIMDITSQDSTSTLHLYPPRYGVRQPLFIRDPIPLEHFFRNLDSRTRTLGILEVSKKMVMR
ncbi:hypothetical protein AC481_06945 [miscellaneous Crenarchaeota group archaeon SMTZ-80]|nr:MAG: hypothetical protein AC481_06945 [miscellaneous Crenarchaeota group archaeon SMTZ-80]